MEISGPRGRVSSRWPRWTLRVALLTLVFGSLSITSLVHVLKERDWQYYATAVGAYRGSQGWRVFRTTDIASFVSSLALGGIEITRRTDASGNPTVYLRQHEK